jgi:hypothetical protein
LFFMKAPAVKFSLIIAVQMIFLITCELKIDFLNEYSHKFLLMSPR